MSYKQPRSIQVVVFSEETSHRSYLMLRRLPGFGSFWQTVTGSLEEGESHVQAAVREVREETGVDVREEDLIDLGLRHRFEIAEQWRSRFAPGTTHNEETCFALPVTTEEVVIDPLEHDSFEWVDYETAIGMAHWESTKRALTAVHELPRTNRGA
jgi:dihydroneopterin triphosphate diphosphatase